MLVPSEYIVVLEFLLVFHFCHVFVQLGEHVEIGEGQVVADEECARLEVTLKILSLLVVLPSSVLFLLSNAL